MKIKIILLFLLALRVESVLAGGSWEAVRVENVKLSSDIDYVLLIELVPRGPSEVQWVDPMFRGCNRLEIHGTFGPLRATGHFSELRDVFSPPKHPELTKAKHLEAVAYLKNAETEHRIINFGYIGTGFEPIEPKKPCIVASRSLEVYEDHGSTAVVSYHNDF